MMMMICIYIYIYIYIYICDGCPLGFERDTLLYLMSSLPSPTPLNCMCSLVTLQASQTATDFAAELAQPFSFVCSDIIWVRDRFCTFTQMAFETSKR